MYKPLRVASIAWENGLGKKLPKKREQVYAKIASTFKYNSVHNSVFLSRPNFPIYIDPLFQINVLGVDLLSRKSHSTEYSLFQFSPTGKLRRNLLVASGETVSGYRVIDFAIRRNLYILDRFVEDDLYDSVFRLRKINLEENELLWTRLESRIETDKGIDRILFGSDDMIYLVSKSGDVVEIDGNSGQFVRLFSFASKTLYAHMTLDGFFYAQRPSDGITARAIVICDKVNSTCRPFSTALGAQDVFLGVDDIGRAYVCSDSKLICLTGVDEHQELPVEGVVVDEKGNVWFSFWNLERRILTIDCWTEGGEHLLTSFLNLFTISWQSPFIPKLIQVDRESYYVKGHNALYRYSKDGILLSKQVFKGSDAETSLQSKARILFPIESRIEPCSYIKVDRKGRVYLPVVGPRGLDVIRMEIEW